MFETGIFLWNMQVNNSSSDEQLKRALDGNDQTDAVLAAGWVRVLTLENKGLAIWQLTVHEFFEEKSSS